MPLTTDNIQNQAQEQNQDEVRVISPQNFGDAPEGDGALANPDLDGLGFTLDPQFNLAGPDEIRQMLEHPRQRVIINDPDGLPHVSFSHNNIQGIVPTGQAVLLPVPVVEIFEHQEAQLRGVNQRVFRLTRLGQETDPRKMPQWRGKGRTDMRLRGVEE